MSEKKLRLYNPSSGATEDVPVSKATEYLMSGYTIKPGTEIDMQSDTGEGGTIDSGELSDALDKGYQIDSPELKGGREIKRKYGSQPIKAAAISAARGLTLGASDVALVASDIMSPQDLSGTEEHNPIADPVGEIAGTVGGLLMSGGTSLVAKVGGAGAKLALGAGEVAAVGTKTLTKMAGKSFAAKLAQKGAPELMRGAAEGVVYESGHMISGQALGDPALTAEQVASNLGMGAMLGGAAQGIFSAAAKAAPTTMGIAKKLKGAASDKVGDAKGAAANIFGVTPARLRKMTAQGKDPSDALVTLQKYGIKPTDDIVESYHTVYKKVGSEIGDTYTALDNAGASSGRTLNDVYDPNQVREEIMDIYSDLLRKGDASDLTQAAKIKGMLKGMGLNKNRDPGYIGSKSMANDGVFTQMRKLRDTLSSKAEWDKFKPVGEQGAAVKAAKIAHKNVNDQIEAIVNKGVSEGTITGEAAQLGTNLRELNRDFSRLKTVERDILTKEAKGSIGGISLKDQVTAFSLIGLGGDVGAALQIAKTMGNSDAAHMIKFNFLKKMSQSQDKTTKKVTEGVNRLLQPAKRKTRVVVPATTSVLSNLTFEPSKKKPAKESRHEAFTRVSNELAGLNSFESLSARLEESTADMSRVAPHLAGAMQMKMAGAVDFLQSKLPRNPAAGRTTNADVRNWKPSKAELSKFERYAAAVNDPTSVLDQLANGLVNRDGIEAIEMVYPEMFADIQLQVLQGLGEFQETMKYSERLNIGAAFNIPVDLASQPEYIMALQGNFQPAEQPAVQGQGHMAPQTHDEAKIGQSDRATTPFQSTIS